MELLKVILVGMNKNGLRMKFKKGLNQEIVKKISESKNEPDWMLEFRLRALDVFEKLPMPSFGPDLSLMDVQNLYYFVKPIEMKKNWEDVPDVLKKTFEKIGVPQAERRFLAGTISQVESEAFYKSLQSKWKNSGVVFLDTDAALKEYPDLFKQYFSTLISSTDNKFAALNCAVWSGGSFLYVPKGIAVELPVQAYFRMETPNFGQFERTLIIVEEGAKVHYVEGCSAPVGRNSSLHCGVVEVFANKNSTVRYTTIQNWSKNVYNLVTKRALAKEGAKIEWIDGNFGSNVTMKYPGVILEGDNSKTEIISVALASSGQHQDVGANVIHKGKSTTSNIHSKTICKDFSKATFRGWTKIENGAENAKSRSKCDTIILGENIQVDSFPDVFVQENSADVGHEASISYLDELQLLYLTSRGISLQNASALLVNGFFDSFVKELPMEYAVEINRLVAMEMEDSIG
ncbi:MAG: FeS assembly protein SufB [candidate division TM6 bacterium GW2011_GWF2_32_72]|nr:MAG: FeS assembly protein SufB [candidate division TM6 bacterium GW2011_GWF2_32_72]